MEGVLAYGDARAHLDRQSSGARSNADWIITGDEDLLERLLHAQLFITIVDKNIRPHPIMNLPSEADMKHATLCCSDGTSPTTRHIYTYRNFIDPL